MVLNKQCYNKWLVNHALLISYGTFPCSRRKMDIKSELNGLTFQWLTTASLLPNALVFSFLNMWETVHHFIMKKKSTRERAQKASPRHTSNTCTRTPRIEKNYHTQIDAHNQLTQGKGCIQDSRVSDLFTKWFCCYNILISESNSKYNLNLYSVH